jgi:hypothetical protein
MRFTPQKAQTFEFVIALVEGRIAGASVGLVAHRQKKSILRTLM